MNFLNIPSTTIYRCKFSKIWQNFVINSLLLLILLPDFSIALGQKSLTPQPDNSLTTSKTPLKLYGRLEEVVTQANPKLPSQFLKLKPSLDSDQEATLKASAQKTSYPSDFVGTWSGNLAVYQNVVSPKYYEIDNAEATNTKKVLKINMQGNVSFDFYKSNHKITLKPATIHFLIPFSETYLAQKSEFQGLKALGNYPGANNQLMQQMSSMLNQMPNYLDVILGNAQNITGVSGNILENSLISNTVKILSSNIIEQDLIVSGSSQNPTTRKINKNFSETVLKFKKINAQQLYVETASVNYTSHGEFLNKLVFRGYVSKSNIAQENNPSYPNNSNNPNNNLFNSINNMLAPLQQNSHNQPNNPQPNMFQFNNPGTSPSQNNTSPYNQNYNWSNH